MRTTLSLDAEVVAELRAFADANGISVSRAANDIIRRGLRPQSPALKRINGLGVILRQPGTPTISVDTTLRLLDGDPPRKQWATRIGRTKSVCQADQ